MQLCYRQAYDLEEEEKEDEDEDEKEEEDEEEDEKWRPYQRCERDLSSVGTRLSPPRCDPTNSVPCS
jgi:hypothetical protein